MLHRMAGMTAYALPLQPSFCARFGFSIRLKKLDEGFVLDQTRTIVG